jgi:tetratricopeptide (TPR) repeat protein
MKKTATTYRQTPVDMAVAAGLLVFVAGLSLFAVRNNDIWWLLAVARRIVETKAFITEDPFTFTVTGTPWAPQWYVSALIFHAIYSAASAWGLIVLRAILVVGIFAVSLRTLARVSAPWALAAPVVLIALLNAHSRFLVRAHLFEYLFLVLLVWFLLTARDHKGKSFFVFPVVLQVLWVNMHPSFMLAPVLVVLFFGGEWVAERLSRSASFVRPYNESGYDWRRVGLLIALMLVACVVNPSPVLFLTQPLGGEQRELISRFTLEWRSPFDPALKHGAFHPYYEILLGLAALSIVLSIGRLRLAPALMIAATAYLSFQAHRFRVEFALVSLPMIFVLLRSSTVVDSIRRRAAAAKNGTLIAQLVAVAVTAVLVVTSADRVRIGEDVADRYPAEAFDFVRAESLAHRPFHTIGHGSYLLWHLYGERQSFIDGRNFAPLLYRDFLACQMNDQGRRGVADRYRLDSFILPPIEKSDAGIERVHRSLAQDKAWTLCYLDRHAWIYVRNDAVDARWLEKSGHRTYHPLTLHNRRLSEADLRAAREELERAIGVSPEYARIRIDLALVYMVGGDRRSAMREIERALEIEPDNKAALDLRERLQSPG